MTTVRDAELRVEAYEQLIEAASVPRLDLQPAALEEGSGKPHAPLPHAEYEMLAQKLALMERVFATRKPPGPQQPQQPTFKAQSAEPTVEECTELDLAGLFSKKACENAASVEDQTTKQLTHARATLNQKKEEVLEDEAEIRRATGAMKASVETMKLLAAIQAGRSLQRWTSDLNLLDDEGTALLSGHLEQKQQKLTAEVDRETAAVDALQQELDPKRNALDETRTEIRAIESNLHQNKMHDHEGQQMLVTYEKCRLVNALCAKIGGWTWEPSQSESDLNQTCDKLQIRMCQGQYRLSLALEKSVSGSNRVHAIALDPPSVPVADILSSTVQLGRVVREVEMRLQASSG